MQTKLSTKGQVVVPGPLRRKLGLRPGDALDVRAEDGSIVLTPRRTRLRKPRIIIDSITGLPVLTAGPDAPVLTRKHVDEILSNFP
jgi:AbrB family looped-hinge helix DNA binding protein